MTLEEACFLLVDQKLWLPLRQLVDSEDHTASQEIVWGLVINSSPDIGIIQYYRIKAGECSTSMEEKIRITAYNTAEKIIASLKQQLIDGNLAATGITSRGDRIAIEPALWEKLHILVVKETAASDDFSFSHLRISRPLERGVPVAECKRWLLADREGYAGLPKDVVLAKARGELGGHLTTTTFNAAYLAVFKRRRGRPRKPPE